MSTSDWVSKYETVTQPTAVVILAVGMAASAARCVKALAEDVSRVPVCVCTGYTLPAWVGPTTLVVAFSASGLSQEVIYSVSDATERGCAVWIISGLGGHLADIAEAQTLPWLNITCDERQPYQEFCASFWSLYGSLAKILNLAGLRSSEGETAVSAMMAQSTYFDDPSRYGMTPPFLLAEAIHRTRLSIYCTPGIAFAGGTVLQSMSRNTSNTHCSLSQIPDLEYDDLYLWRRYDQQWDWSASDRDKESLLILKDCSDSSLITDRVQAVRQRVEIDAPLVDIHELTSSGASSLERLVAMVQFGAWFLGHLAERPTR